MFSRTILAGIALAMAASEVAGFASMGPVAPSIRLGGRVSVSPALVGRQSMLSPTIKMTATAPNTNVNPYRPASIPYTIIDTLPEDYAWIVPKDGLTVKERIAKYVETTDLTASDQHILISWMDNFKEALQKASHTEAKKFCVEDYFCVLAELVRKERKRPHYFEGTSVTGTQYEKYNSHHADSKFFDYQKFGIDVTRPLVDWEQSEVLGAENLKKIKAQLDAGENVVLCSNHQSESDTHCIFTVLEDQMGPDFGEIGRNMVFIAGERVLRDAIVVPFSRGCSLLTVYSKKHIDSEPALKADKMTHNGKTMKQLGAFFHKGGTCMWFAPSGGRDRRSADTGKVELSPFDANSIEMMRQVATQAGALEKTHFYAMALATHNIFPPPTSVGGSYGEERVVNFVPLRLAVSEEIPEIPYDTTLEGAALKAAIKQSRVVRAEKVFNMMKSDYEKIQGYTQ